MRMTATYLGGGHVNSSRAVDGALAAKALIAALIVVRIAVAGGYLSTRPHASQSNAAPVNPPAASAAAAPKPIDPELLASALSIQMSLARSWSCTGCSTATSRPT